MASAIDLTHADDYAWVGFDLDHALARYKVPALMSLVHDSLVVSLLENEEALAGVQGVREILSSCFDPALVHKGIIVDFRLGDVVKLTENGTVAAAWHGGAPLSIDTFSARYREDDTWWGFDLLTRQARHEAFFVLLTYFDMPCVCLASRLIALVDEGLLAPGEGEGALRYGPVKAMLMRAFEHIFDNVHGWSGRGGFFTALRQRTGEFVCRRPGLREWLLARRRSGKRVFLATNSQQRFADMLLSHALGEDWAACFDLVVYNCLKPAFFAKVQQSHAVDYETGTEGEPQRVVSLAPPAAPREPGSGGEAGAARDLPPAVLLVQSHAGVVQALADAERLLLRAAAPSTRAASGGTPVGSPSGGGSDGGAGGSHVHVHLDEAGRVTGVTVGPALLAQSPTASPLATDAAGPPTPEDATPVAHTPLPVRLRQVKPAVSAGMAAYLAHGSAPAVNAGDAAVSEVAAPRQHTTGTGSGNGNGNGDAATTQLQGAAALAQARRDASEPAQALSLIDALSRRRDPATGAELQHGGAEAHHPGHERILYVGDHLHGDVVASVTECEWDACAVVEELEVWGPGKEYGDARAAACAFPVSPTAAATDAASVEHCAGVTPLSPPNFSREYADRSVWGSFFAAGHGPASPAAAAADGTPRGARKSYFGSLLLRHAAVAVSDIEPWLLRRS